MLGFIFLGFRMVCSTFEKYRDRLNSLWKVKFVVTSHHMFTWSKYRFCFLSLVFIYIYGLVFKFWVVLKLRKSNCLFFFLLLTAILPLISSLFLFLFKLNKISHNNDDDVASDKNHEHSIFNQKTKTKIKTKNNNR